MLVCKFLGFSITGNLENLMCAGIYGGLIVGLVGGNLISVRVIQTPLHGIEDKYKIKGLVLQNSVEQVLFSSRSIQEDMMADGIAIDMAGSFHNIMELLWEC